jgi:hypothetical protein
MSDLRDALERLVGQVERLDVELRRAAAAEAQGVARPEVQRALMVAIPAIQAEWAGLKAALAAGAPDAVVWGSLLALHRDLTAVLLVLQGRLRLIGPGEEPN